MQIGGHRCSRSQTHVNVEMQIGAIGVRDLRHMSNLKCRLGHTFSRSQTHVKLEMQIGATSSQDLEHISNLKCRLGPQVLAILNTCQTANADSGHRFSRSQTGVKTRKADSGHENRDLKHMSNLRRRFGPRDLKHISTLKARFGQSVLAISHTPFEPGFGDRFGHRFWRSQAHV